MWEGGTHFVDLSVFGHGLIVWFLGDVFVEGHGLEDAVVPLERFFGVLSRLLWEMDDRMARFGRKLTRVGISGRIVDGFGELELLNDFPHHVDQRLRRPNQGRFRVLSDVVRERERRDPESGRNDLGADVV